MYDIKRINRTDGQHAPRRGHTAATLVRVVIGLYAAFLRFAAHQLVFSVRLGEYVKGHGGGGQKSAYFRPYHRLSPKKVL